MQVEAAAAAERAKASLAEAAHEAIDSAGPAALVALLELHVANPDLAGNLVARVGDLAWDTAKRDLLGEAGAAGHIASVLRAHPDHWRMQAQSFRTLCHLAKNHPANAAAAREAGCVQLITTAMRAYPDNEDLQKECRDALEILEV